jgi:hypothetical protein
MAPPLRDRGDDVATIIRGVDPECQTAPSRNPGPHKHAMMLLAYPGRNGPRRDRGESVMSQRNLLYIVGAIIVVVIYFLRTQQTA